MRWADRKAYALTSAMVDALRRVDPSQADLGVRSLDRGARDLADFVCGPTEDGRQRLDEFLSEAVEKAIQGAEILHRSDVSASVGERLRARAGEVVCVACANGAVCNGTPRSDDRIVSDPSGGACIGNIKLAFDVAVMMAREAYAAVLAVDSFPDVVLSTDGVTDPPGRLPAGIGLVANGMTSFDDGADGFRSVVLVRIAPLAYNRFTAAAMPYLLLHEVLCHGFQMARSRAPRAGKRAITDPVSEGMLDAVAVELLERCAHEDDGRTEIEAVLAGAEAAAARQIHLARQSRDNEPRFPEADAVALGVHAHHLVKRAFAQFGDPDGAVARRFALALNVHEWDYGERHEGLTLLASALRKPRDVHVFKLLDAFRVDGDAGPVLDHLSHRTGRPAS